MRAIRRGRCDVLIAAQLCSALLAGCASSPRMDETVTLYRASVTTDADERRLRRASMTLTPTDFDLPGVTSAFDAVRRLRPEFLLGSRRSPMAGPPEIAVYLNDTYQGEIFWLSTVPLSETREIRFLHPVEATQRFGATCRCASGVILVTTRRAGRR